MGHPERHGAGRYGQRPLSGQARTAILTFEPKRKPGEDLPAGLFALVTRDEIYHSMLKASSLACLMAGWAVSVSSTVWSIWPST